MPQDAFTIRLVARELDRALRGGKINKINQPKKEELALLIYTQNRTVKLTVNANAADCGVYFTDAAQENPLVAPNFCMLLRKHLTGAELLSVETPGFERIVVFRLMCYSDFSSCERELYVEIMGKYSNVILTEKGVILGAMKTTALDDNCKRALFPGLPYTLPAPQDKVNPTDYEALAALLREPHENLPRFLFTGVAGLAPCTAEQIVNAYRGGEFAKHVYDYIFSDTVAPRVVERDGTVCDFFARAEEGKAFETLSEAQSYFYGKRRAQKSTEAMRRRLVSAISAAVKKQEKLLAQLREKRLACKDAELNRTKGDLLTANLYRLERGMRACELTDYTDGKPMKITLDERLTPAQNAQAYYKRYRKQKRTLEFLGPQQAETEAELDYLQSVLAAAEAAEREDDLLSVNEELLAAGLIKAPQERARRAKPEIPFRTCEYAGFTIYAGRNNLQNDRLVRSSAPNDIWLHAQRYHSCHVVIKTNGKPVSEDVILYAAAICARYSDGKGDKIAVDYCLVKHVKKPPKSKAGFVTYTEYKTVLADGQA